MLTTFTHVTISVEAETPEAAYAKLTEALDPLAKANALEYQTDTFFTDDEPDDERDTAELWPVEKV